MHTHTHTYTHTCIHTVIYTNACSQLATCRFWNLTSWFFLHARKTHFSTNKTQGYYREQEICKCRVVAALWPKSGILESQTYVQTWRTQDSTHVCVFVCAHDIAYNFIMKAISVAHISHYFPPSWPWACLLPPSRPVSCSSSAGCLTLKTQAAAGKSSKVAPSVTRPDSSINYSDTLRTRGALLLNSKAAKVKNIHGRLPLCMDDGVLENYKSDLIISRLGIAQFFRWIMHPYVGISASAAHWCMIMACEKYCKNLFDRKFFSMTWGR